MKTAVLHVAQPAGPGQDYPVQLLLDDGARANWRNHPLASGTIPADLSVSAPPMNAFRPGPGPLTAADIRQLLLDREQHPNLFGAMGDLLRQLLLPKPVEDAWLILRNAAVHPGADPLRTFLDIAPPCLEDLPWELIGSFPDFFFLDQGSRLMRGGFPPASNGQVETLEWPIRMLVVVGAAPGDPKIQWKEEVQAIRDATCEWRHWFDVEYLLQPDSEALSTAWRDLRPHVLHFIGHGRPASIGRQASLEISHSSSTWDWTEQLIHLQLGHAPPRFAFLNACHTAQMSEQEGGWGIGKVLLKAGVGAVLGMQGNIDGAAAAQFATRFYTSFIQGEPLDLAVVEARRKISVAAARVDYRDWALPWLKLSVLPEQVLPMEPLSSAGQQVLVSQEFDIPGFVDRANERRKIRTGLEPRQQQGSPFDLVVVHGTSEIGKTWLVKCCLQGCAAREHQVVYVNLQSKDKSLDAVEILRRLRGAKTQREATLLQPWIGPHFGRFNEVLNHLLQGIEPPERTAASRKVLDQGAAFDPAKAHPDLLRRIFDPFRAALQKAAGGRPLVIAFDHFGDRGNGGALPDHFEKYLLPELIEPVARRRVRPVRMVVSLRGTNEDPINASSFAYLGPADVKMIEVELLPADQFEALFRDFLLLLKLDPDKPKGVIEAVRALHNSPWSPTLFQRVLGVIPADAR